MNNGCYGNKTVRFCSRESTNMATASDDFFLDEDFLSRLTKCKKTGRTSIELAVLGSAGIGKSSLINGIIGMELAKEGDDLDPVTKENHDIRVEKNGIEVVLWDTPGLGMDDPEISHQRLKEMKSKSQCIDLLLYCIKMNDGRWPSYCETRAITNITGTFGRQIWQNCQFTLTFGNEVAKKTSEKDKKVIEFKKRVEIFTDRIRKAIQEYAKLTNEEVEKLHVVSVGNPQRESAGKDFCHDLPDGKDWFINLLKSCICTMQKEAVAPFLCVRMFDDNSVNPQDVHDLHSAYPITPPRMDETEDRSLDLDKENDSEGHDALLEEDDPSHKNLHDHVHVDQQVDGGKGEEHASSENGEADTHLDQQHVDNVQDDTRHDDQELYQRKIPHRVLHAILNKDQANFMQCIAKHEDKHKLEKRKFQGYAGFIAWLETIYHMEF